jgi:spore coat polysaccharide biosynthesis predicted glycosyltransferase SpsG/CMP-N-acetylneuraminic acid synthetase
MKQGLRVLAVVPARGGTDTIPYLNIKRLGDRPLLAHTLDAARAAPSVDRVVVSTDDPGVRDAALADGAEAPFLRPPELAGNIPSLKPVIAHAVAEMEREGFRADLVVVLQATSPFREAAAIEEALEKLVAGGYDSVISVTEDRTLSWREEAGRLVPLFAKEGRREEQAPVYKENGAVVALRRAVLDAASRFGEKVGHLVLDKRAAFTVHDLGDFWMAERLLREPRVLFRVDGGAELGMGHVYRSLAIAEALRAARADVAFLMKADHPQGLVTVSKAGYPVRVVADEQLETCLGHIRDFTPEILVNDLKELDGRYLRALSHLGTATVNLVDAPEDLEATGHYGQFIISFIQQERETAEGFYEGPAYAILREQFRDREKEVRPVSSMVLLSFGGSDPQGLTLKAARALMGLDPGVSLVAVAGPAFGRVSELKALQARLPRKLDVIEEPGGHIAELMLEADVMVGSGGMSVYEIAALGTPGVILGQNAREDRRMREFARHGTIEYLGLGTEVGDEALAEAVTALLKDAPRRREMSGRGRRLVDGLGAQRAAELVLGHGRKPREAALPGGGQP